MTTKRVAILALLTVLCLTLPTFAKQPIRVMQGAKVIREVKHDTGPIMREISPLLPEYGVPTEREIENNANPRNPWKGRPIITRDAVLQTPENSPTLQTPNFSLEFEGIGSGSGFFCNCEPPDNDAAAGTTQFMEYINTTWEVWDKKGNVVKAAAAGNSFWSGFGGSCQNDNSGDPIVRFDAAAQRWVVSQFAINSVGNDFECVAVSTTTDATGSYNRYAFSFADFPDYPKMGVWPDAYYFTFNNFNLQGTAFVGPNVCAADRSKMLTGAAATIQCFQQSSSNWSFLPSDLDGPNAPPAGTPNFVAELDPTGAANINMFKFHVDWANPANSTFTGPTQIAVSAFTPLCNTQSRGRCVKQPTVGSDLLESLGDRLMYRLVYRNFGDHSVLLASHSIVAGTSGGIRWYEIHNPETTPTIYQSGTFAPDSQFRWMPAIAMDAQQNIAIGFSRSGSGTGQYPSLVYTGRVPSDPLGTMESEVTLLAGTGSQTGGGDRWGDYTSLTIDPVDDCTFWFEEEYQAINGGFDWHTAIGSFTFPGCGGGTPDFSLSANPNTLSIAQGSQGTSTITVTPINGFNSSVTLSASGLPSGVTAGFSPNPATTTSTLTLTASPTATTGTSTVTITGMSGNLSHTTSVSLTVTQSNGGPVVSLSPTSLKWGTVVAGSTSCCKTVTLTNTGQSNLNITGIAISGDFALKSSATACSTAKPVAPAGTCTFKVSFTPTQMGARTGSISITDNAPGSPQSIGLSGTGGAQATLTPTSATYAKQAVGTTSPAKTFTFTNKLSTTLSGISIGVSGDFAIATNSCASTLGAKGQCTVTVTFTPTAVGTRTGSLTANFNGVGSPQTSKLTGTGF